VLGLVLLPFSLLGLLADGVGIFGFSPFLTALALGWQARRVSADTAVAQRSLRFWLGALLYVAGGVLVQVQFAPVYQQSLR